MDAADVLVIPRRVIPRFADLTPAEVGHRRGWARLGEGHKGCQADEVGCAGDGPLHVGPNDWQGGRETLQRAVRRTLASGPSGLTNARRSSRLRSPPASLSGARGTHNCLADRSAHRRSLTIAIQDGPYAGTSCVQLCPPSLLRQNPGARHRQHATNPHPPLSPLRSIRPARPRPRYPPLRLRLHTPRRHLPRSRQDQPHRRPRPRRGRPPSSRDDRARRPRPEAGPGRDRRAGRRRAQAAE